MNFVTIIPLVLGYDELETLNIFTSEYLDLTLGHYLGGGGVAESISK